MANLPRFIKTFSVTGRRFYKNNQPVRTERPDTSLDDLVNAWVKSTGNIVINATPARHTVMERGHDGEIIRKTSQMVMVVYQSEGAFLEAEGELRRRALVPLPRKDEGEDRPMPMTDDEERRERTETLAPLTGGSPDKNAGGPAGLDQMLPAEENDDEF